VEAGAGRIAGRRVFVVGTGTSWHAANQGAYFLRLAGVDAAAGPGFAMGLRDGLVCLDGGGPGAARVTELVDAIGASGTRVYRFSATELGEPLSVFPLTATVQRIALGFAVQLDTDPDDVRPEGWEAIQI